MGTSTSSAGAGAGSPFDPTWLDSAGESIDDSHSDNVFPPPDDGDGGGESPEISDGDASQSNVGGQESNADTAPSGRYKEARTSMGRFMRTGDCLRPLWRPRLTSTSRKRYQTRRWPVCRKNSHPRTVLVVQLDGPRRSGSHRSLHCRRS